MIGMKATASSASVGRDLDSIGAAPLANAAVIHMAMMIPIPRSLSCQAGRLPLCQNERNRCANDGVAAVRAEMYGFAGGYKSSLTLAPSKYACDAEQSCVVLYPE
jgi:hypothetical protein